MKLLVTGATGFLGRYVVAEALRRGHVVRALVRGGGGAVGATSTYGWENDPGVELVRADLRSRERLVEACGGGVEAVLHLAAAKAGDLYEQYAGTVVATENLLWAMAEAGVRRIVHVSSFAVYDYMKMREWAVLDEGSPVEADAFERDAYAQTKLVQERLVRAAGEAHGWGVTVLRPGMVYGPDNLWNARCGVRPRERLWVRTGSGAPMPLTYVENCAEAIVLAAEQVGAAGQTLNVVDDDPPSHRRYVKLLQRLWPAPQPRVVPVPWTLMRVVARSAWLTNRLLLRGKAKLPGLLIPCRLHARLKPLRYSNERAKRVLGWRPRYDLETAVRRSLGLSDGAAGAPRQKV